MPHISSKQLKHDTYYKLYEQFLKTINSSTTHEARVSLDDLLSETEKIMLAKRLSATLLLSQGASLYSISRTLQLSTSSVSRFQTAYELGSFDNVLRSIGKKPRVTKDLWKLLGTLSRAGLPPMSGKGRWNMLRPK